MTKDKPITFARLEAVLSSLEFAKTVLAQKCVTYEHTPSGTVLYIRPHRPNEIQCWDELASARHHWEWGGFIEPSRFDDLLHRAAA